MIHFIIALLSLITGHQDPAPAPPLPLPVGCRVIVPHADDPTHDIKMDALRATYPGPMDLHPTEGVLAWVNADRQTIGYAATEDGAIFPTIGCALLQATD